MDSVCSALTLSGKDRRNLNRKFVFIKSLIIFLLYIAIVASNITGLMSFQFVTQPNPKIELTKTTNEMEQFLNYYISYWNYVALMFFLVIAILDEASILTNRTILHQKLKNIRQYLFLAIVLPGSFVVMGVFWSLWHINRELIFPKDFDVFFPSWLNHIFHTLIIIPLIIEVISQRRNYTVSRKYIIIILTLYLGIYQSLYLSLYFRYGVWLYRVYESLSWSTRSILMFGVFFYALLFQNGAFYILRKPANINKTE